MSTLFILILMALIVAAGVCGIVVSENERTDAASAASATSSVVEGAVA
jgi:hypothetical protein